jgi:hypothetical protein
MPEYTTKQCPPVLLLVFNRPDLTAKVFGRIRKAQPSQLFVAADGPRPTHPKDQRLCQAARDVATQVDWDCELCTLFRDENLGLKEAVSSAITWFFQHVESGIILEDDCVPHPSFFSYCGELLEKYGDDERVMAISGNNFQPETRSYRASYYFSAYPHCWGWATWSKAWNHYDGGISAWSHLRDTGWLEGWLGSSAGADYWAKIFDRVARNKVNSWAYPWTFSCWSQHGLSILPTVNLVSNVGFGEYSTHTSHSDSAAAHLPTGSLSFPLDHPGYVARNYSADRYTLEDHFGVGKSRSKVRVAASSLLPARFKNIVRTLIPQQ